MEDETRITGDDQNSDESASPEAQKDNESFDPGAIDALLSKEEIDALLNVVSTDSLDPSDAAVAAYYNDKVEVYDFTAPTHLSRDHVRSLRSLHSNYARNLSSALSVTLRSAIDVECVHIEQLNYGEYLSSVLDPSCIGVFSIEPLNGYGVLEMNPTLVFPMIDMLLGGSANNTVFYNRPLTNIEESIIEKVIEQILSELQLVWQESADLTMKLERLESSPQFIHIAAQSDPVIVILFDIKLENIQNMLSLCFPFATMHNTLEELRRRDTILANNGESAESHRKTMRAFLDDTYLTLSARYEPSPVTFGELLDLQKGDIIKLENADKNKALIFVDEKHKFYGKPGMANGRRAVQVLGLVGNENNKADDGGE